jgi:hypothetical protein
MGQMNMNPSMGGGFRPKMGDRQNLSDQVKKMPNPSNYKIVKCKNFEMGKLIKKKLKKF